MGMMMADVTDALAFPDPTFAALSAMLQAGGHELSPSLSSLPAAREMATGLMEALDDSSFDHPSSDAPFEGGDGGAAAPSELGAVFVAPEVHHALWRQLAPRRPISSSCERRELLTRATTVTAQQPQWLTDLGHLVLTCESPVVDSMYLSEEATRNDCILIAPPCRRNITGDDVALPLGSQALEHVRPGAAAVEAGRYMAAALVHSVLHVCGYNHESDAEFAEMAMMEKVVIRSLLS
jgi:hypothetical protein